MLEAGTFGDQFLAVSLFGQAEEQWKIWHGHFQLNSCSCRGGARKFARASEGDK